MENLEEISKIIDQVIMEFGLPKTAVGVGTSTQGPLPAILKIGYAKRRQKFSSLR